MPDAAIKDKIRAYVSDTYFVDFGEEEDALSTSDDLFAEGVFDSLALVQFVEYLEEEFGVSVEESVLMDGEMQSVDAAAAYVEAQRSRSAG